MGNASPPTAANRLGPTAFVLHVLAIVSASAIYLIQEGVRDNRPNWAAVVSVGGAAAVVVLCWSALLAIRAAWKGEALCWPYMVLAALAIEVSAPFIYYWIIYQFHFKHVQSGTLWQYALPVFVPFVCLTPVINLALASWLVKRAEGRKQMAIDSRSRRRRGVKYWAALTSLASVLILPVLLFFFCAGSSGSTNTGFYPRWESSDLTLHKFVIRVTPKFIGDAFEYLFPDTFASLCLRHNGALSERRLRECIETGYRQIHDDGMVGFRASHPDRFMEYALQIGQRKLRSEDLESEAGDYVARNGTPEQVALFLNGKDYYELHAFYSQFFRVLGVRDHELAISSLERFLAEGPLENRSYVLTHLAEFGRGQRLSDTFRRCLSSMDSKLQMDAAGMAVYIEDPAVWREISTLCVRIPDKKVRVRFVEMCDVAQRPAETPPEAVAGIAALLDDSDLRIRRAAVHALARIFDEHNRLNTPRSYEDDGGSPPKPVAETPEERVDVAIIRQCVAERLRIKK